MIRVNYNNNDKVGFNNYYISQNDELSWNLISEWNHKVNLTWNPLYWVNKEGEL